MWSNNQMPGHQNRNDFDQPLQTIVQHVMHDWIIAREKACIRKLANTGWCHFKTVYPTPGLYS